MVDTNKDDTTGDNLFAGQGLDAIDLAAQNAKLNRLNSSIEDIEVDDAAVGGHLFTGDFNALDKAALAAQAEEMAKLVESMVESLEINELDSNQDNEQWSAAAKISTDDDVENDKNNKGIKLEEIAQKINKKPTKSIQEIEEEEEEEEKKKREAKQAAENASLDGNKAEQSGAGEETNEAEADAAINDDMSIDDSESSESDASSLSTLKSSQHEASDSDESMDDANETTQAHHMSSKSLSLAEIQVDMEDQDESASGSHSELLQNGILRIDPNSDQKAFICDWDRWRQWKQQQCRSSKDNNSRSLNSSSQRWADSSLQDSGLKMPLRRRGEEDMSDSSQDVSFFDWKEWRRKKEGQRSSTSRTNSLSMSASEDAFDADSVLAKLDEWEIMEESRKSEAQNDSDDSDASSSRSENDSSEGSVASKAHDASASSLSHHDLSAPTGGVAKLNRANSEVFNSKRMKLPDRAHSDHSIQVEDENEKQSDNSGQWKNWQREKRTSKMRGSWSDMSGFLEGSGHSSAGHSDDNESQQSFATEGSTSSWGDSSKEGFALQDTEATKPAREPETAPSARPQLKNRSHSLQIRPPSRRSLHMSPMRSPMTRSPAVVDKWKSWQREKRRTGMLKKSLSASGSWGLPGQDDSATEDSKNSGRRKKLTKSQSEKWEKKQSGNRRQHMKRASSLNMSKPSNDNDDVFDWKAFRNDNRRSDFQRSKSDRWASNSAAGKSTDSDKPPTVPVANGLRRAHSENWDARGGKDLTLVPTQGPPASGKPPAKGDAFDWKAFRKDRRRSMRKSKSERIEIGVTS